MKTTRDLSQAERAALLLFALGRTGCGRSKAHRAKEVQVIGFAMARLADISR